MVRTLTVPLADLNEVERIERGLQYIADLGSFRGGETVDRNRSKGVLSEEVTGCEARRCDDDDIRSIDVVERELGILVLEDRRIQFVDGEEAASSPVFDTAPADMKFSLGIIKLEYMFCGH